MSKICCTLFCCTLTLLSVLYLPCTFQTWPIYLLLPNKPLLLFKKVSTRSVCWILECIAAMLKKRTRHHIKVKVSHFYVELIALICNNEGSASCNYMKSFMFLLNNFHVFHSIIFNFFFYPIIFTLFHDYESKLNDTRHKWVILAYGTMVFTTQSNCTFSLVWHMVRSWTYWALSVLVCILWGGFWQSHPAHCEEDSSAAPQNLLCYCQFVIIK